MRTTSIRFTGLASGLDTESIVTSMVAPYKLKVDSAKQNQTMMQWKKDAWKDVNSQLFGFYDKYISKMRLESTFNKNKTSMSNNTTVQLDKNTNIPIGTHNIKVDKLATGGIVKTESITQDSNGNKKLDKNGKEITKNTKLEDLTDLGGKNTVAITINEQPIKFKRDSTLSDIEKTLQESDAMKDWNVKFDEGTGAFFVSSKSTGANQNIEIKGGVVGQEFLGAIGFKVDGAGKVEVEAGQNAKYTYNGVELQSSTNDISVNGVKMTLVGTGEVQLVATQDTDALVDFVKEFVDEYNKLIEGLHEKLNAPSAKGYQPLTDEQKKEMSDSEIVAWEKKIKDSLLRRDPDLKAALDEMRGILGETVEGNPFGGLAGIGITTGDWKENGKLYIDEEKLRAALQKDSKAVVDLIAGNGTNVKDKGIADRLYDTITTNTKSSMLKSSYSFYNDKMLDKKMQNEAKEIKKLEARMYAMEDMYYKRFTAMEKMMSQLNNQTNSMMSMLGQG